ncbi:non-ribosomal peptide synthetase family protein [Paenibacillus glycinis]|nr:non-ribosomal peptide synthetase [Paenibacillus glycinis]
MRAMNEKIVDSQANAYQRDNVLLLPTDFPKHHRTCAFSIAEHALGARLSEAMENAAHADPQVEDLLAAVYYAWIYRMSGEKELTAGLHLNDSSICVSLEIEPGATFRGIRELVRGAAASPAPSAGEAETRFAVRRSPKAAGEQLIWQLREREGVWTSVVEYDDSLFKAETIERFAHYYAALLEAALAHPDQSIAGVDILAESDAAAHRLLNATDAAYERNETVHGMVERMAVRYPDKTAVSSSEGALTYRQLNEAANRTARALLAQGIGVGDFVTIYMERSIELIVSLLGVLKAGGAYVPVDPEHPEERNQYIVADTRSAFIVTKERYLDGARGLSAGAAAVKDVLLYDRDFAGFDGSDNPSVGVLPDDLAYIIYTSGSTGRPKGALIRHEGVVNLGETVRRDCKIEPEDVLTQFSTYSFDASVWDTIGALFYGATLYLLSPEERISVELFATAVERTGTTIIAILPTVFFNEITAYLSDEGYRKLAGVKLITVAGEALYGAQVRAFQRHFRDRIAIVNVYGPTECTVCTTTHVVDALIPDELTNVPIGKPIGNYKVYILNEANRLCPVNVHGELCISTVGLAKGYLNQPDKTAAAFVPNPFAEGELMYRSGDIVKLLPDGTIEYAGRRDSQIKIRGHRIEIGEIEDNFIKIANVQNVAVIPKKDANGHNMLIGYFTSRDGHPVPPALIKREISEKLPAYFVPKRIVQLDAMPLSPTGKIDRKTLAGYEHREETAEAHGPGPENDTQAAIALAWRAALELEHVGIHDDFFAAGGDSLAVMHVLTLLMPVFPGLKINDFYRCRTVAGLARRTEELQAEALEEALRLPAANPDVSDISANREKTALDEYPLAFGEIRPLPLDAMPKAVLLTGATGYLGSQLLYDLLQQSSSEIYCIVRKSGKWNGLTRLQDAMSHYFGPAVLDLMQGRVIAFEGDLERPDLGFSEADAAVVLAKVDAIIHSAADVRHFGDEERFARTNVDGTRHLVRLAEELPRRVRFHHVSTLGIPEDLALSGQWERVLEQPVFEAGLRVESVYTNSKLEAEKLLIEAAGHGLDVTIYRAGNLTCHSLTGRFQRNIDSNAFYRMIKAMLVFGKAVEADWDVDFTPIDYAGQSIVHLALRPDTIGCVYHICNPVQLPYSQLLDGLRGFGYDIETLAPSAYGEWLMHSGATGNLEAVKLAMAQLEGDGAKNSAYRYGCAETTALLSGTGIGCAEPDRDFLRRMIAYAADIGYWPSAPAMPAVTS